MFRHLTIRARLLMTTVFLSLLLAGIGGLGLFSLYESNESLRTVNADRVLPLGQLDTVFRGMLENRMDIYSALGADAEGVQRYLKHIAERRARGEAEWAAYVLTYLNARERVLVPRFNEMHARYVEEGLQPALEALQSGNREKARAITADKLVPLHEAMQPTMNELIQTQIDESRLEYKQSQEIYATYRLVSLVATVLGIVMGTSMSVWAIVGIRRQLKMALDLAHALTVGTTNKLSAVNAIAAGDLDLKVESTSLPPIDLNRVAQDEIGELVKTILKMSEAQLRFDSAFMQMTASLRDSRDSERANDWLKSSQNDLNTLMRGEHVTDLLAQQVLGRLAELLAASVGSFYLFDERAEGLVLVAGYALPAGTVLKQRVGWRQGLNGQALQDDRVLVLADLPEHYLPVNSSLGEARPAALLIVPLCHDGSRIGVVELGMLTVPTSLQMQFLERAREGIAIALSVNLARQKLQALMEQLQVQTEELRVQQEELQQSNEELEERAEMLERQREQIRVQNEEIQAASNALRDKATELERASAYKTEFLSTMSHELRTPLNSMLILSGLLQENKGGNLNAKQVEFAATINSAGRDLLNLINDILDLSKVEAGQLDFNYEAVAVQDICHSLETLFRGSAEQKGLQLALSVASEVPTTLHLDLQRTQQILKNLLANAIKFTHQGEVRLSIALSAGDNPLSLPAVAFAVSDSGIGIAGDKQDLVFQAFKQADGGVSRKYGGTGLGLAISRQLARKMGGEVWLHSVEGQGSTFTLYLPQTPQSLSLGAAAPLVPVRLAASPAPVSASVRPPVGTTALPPAVLPDDRERVQAGARSILIVEDDLNFARVLMDFVREHDFSALVAADGESGLELAHCFRPSAVLLDVMLPGIDGWTVFDKLKGDPDCRQTPVHFISCLEERKKAMDLGAIGFLTKPVRSEQLNEVLQSIARALSAGNKKLLLVEGNADEAGRLQSLLAEEDVAIDCVASGQEALAKLREQAFDCMVLDLDLPDMPGRNLLADLKKEGRTPPVVIYSASELGRDEERALRHYTSSIVIKGAKSQERLLDEVTLFLHMVEKNLPADQKRPARTAADTEELLRGKKVLLVDDDMRNVFSLSSLLAEQEIVVVEAENGREALVQLEANPDVAVILMDIMMPEMDGYETIRHIRRNPQHGELPIIAMTAKAMKGDQQKCLDAGASDYISKPIDTQKLLSLLRVWISHNS